MTCSCAKCGAVYTAREFARLSPAAGGVTAAGWEGIEFRQCGTPDCHGTLTVELAESFPFFSAPTLLAPPAEALS